MLGTESIHLIAILFSELSDLSFMPLIHLGHFFSLITLLRSLGGRMFFGLILATLLIFFGESFRLLLLPFTNLGGVRIMLLDCLVEMSIPTLN